MTTDRLAKPFDLIRAERYSDPDDPAAIIPDVYGDFTVGGLAGPVPAVRIDKATNTYALAAHAIGSVTEVYVGPILTGATINLSNNYQSQGVIATATFGAQPDNVVTWRGTGKMSGGLLIENGVRQIADLLHNRAGFSTSILDFWSGSINLVDTYDFDTAWVINDERDVISWLHEMVFNITGQLFIIGTGDLYLGTDVVPIPERILLGAIPPLAHIVASRDCVNGDDGVEIEGNYEHLVNALDLYYLYNWAGGNPSSRVVTTGNFNRHARISQNAYGEVRKSITLRGIRHSDELQIWANALYDRQSMADRLTGTRLRFQVEGARIAHGTVGDYIGFSWRFGPRLPNGREYRNRLLRITEIEVDAMRGGRTTLSAIDTGKASTLGDLDAVLI